MKWLIKLLFGEPIKTGISSQPQGINHRIVPQEFLDKLKTNEII